MLLLRSCAAWLGIGVQKFDTFDAQYICPGTCSRMGFCACANSRALKRLGPVGLLNAFMLLSVELHQCR